MMDLQGQFLIAMPQLEDYFQNTVVYMCEHNEQGSMGLVINQPTDLSIAELYSKMNFMMKNDRTFSNELVLAGGPVHSERGFILHKKTDKEFEHSYKITDEMFLTTSADIVENLWFRGCARKISCCARLCKLDCRAVRTRDCRQCMVSGACVRYYFI